MSGYTVQGLAGELSVELDHIQAQLKRLGMRGDITPTRSVSKSLAEVIIKSHNAIAKETKKQIAASKSGGSVTDDELAAYTDKLKLRDCDRIAKRMGVSKVFIRDAAEAQRNQRLVLAAKLGAAEYQQERNARQAGYEYAQIEELKEQQTELLAIERQIAIMGVTNHVDGVLDQAGMGGLEELIADIRGEQGKDAKQRQERQEVIRKIQDEGYNPSEEELLDPFVSLAWDQIKYGSKSYAADLGIMSA